MSEVEFTEPGLADKIRWRWMGLCHSVKSSISERCLNLVVRLNRDSNLISYAESEMGESDMTKHVVQVMAAFSHEGHSGGSAPYAIGAITRLLAFKPLGPLTGEDTEWQDIDESELQQNRRRSSVFREKGGRAYDIDALVFRDPDGACYTNGGFDDRKLVEFPYYVPDKPIYIDVDEDGEELAREAT